MQLKGGVCFWILLIFLLGSCKSNQEENRAPASAPATSTPVSCAKFSGTSWVPNTSVLDVSANYHDSNVSVSEQVLVQNGKLTGYGKTQAEGQYVFTFDFTLSQALGIGGSLSLVAEPLGLPDASGGIAYPYLISFEKISSPSATWHSVNSACANEGYFTCSIQSGREVCSPNANCSVSPSTAYAFTTSDASNRRYWEQRQLPFSGVVSTNTFPTCNWSSSGGTTCFFGNNFQLLAGNYQAKYVLFSSQSLHGIASQIRLHVIEKKDADIATGATDLNVILVGDQNIQDSRTPKGKQNLDALFKHVVDYYKNADGGNHPIRFGKITVYEWGCQGGGEPFADLIYSDLETFFQTGSNLVLQSDSSANKKSINIFLVTALDSFSFGISGTLLGLSATIGGPSVLGTSTSGLVFSTFGKLASFNPNCDGQGTCVLNHQESAFVDMGSTIGHEMGHYLGLNHPTESAGASHDFLDDTPTCTATQTTNGPVVTHASCLQDTGCQTACPNYDATLGVFCAQTTQCQFNHLMWYTTKYFDPTAKGGAGDGDGNLLSSESAIVLQLNPLLQ